MSIVWAIVWLRFLPHQPWHCSSITLMPWWTLSSCLLLTSPRFSKNLSKWLWRKCTFLLMFMWRAWKLSSSFCTISCTTSLYLLALWFPRKLWTTYTKLNQLANSISFVACWKLGSFINFRIWGLSKIPAFSFLLLNPGKADEIYWKHCPVLWRALANCFISHSLMWKGGNMILSRGKSWSWITFLSPTFNCSWTGQFVVFQWFALFLLSQ